MNRPIDIEFIKMTGAGNDFVVIDNRRENYALDWKSVAPILCNRRFGIGADGLLIIRNSLNSNFKMDYFNADGSYGGMCGNGGRCSAMLMLNLQSLDSITFEALDYNYSARRFGTDIILKMKPPTAIKLNMLLEIDNKSLMIHSINTGSPHVVIFTDSLSPELRDQMKIQGIKILGQAIRQHRMFQPDGTNVNFVIVQPNNILKMRTYERGVEDETFACGTGAIACTIIFSILYNISPPTEVLTTSKEILRVNFKKSDDKFTDVELCGSAIEVFRGAYRLT